MCRHCWEKQRIAFEKKQEFLLNNKRRRAADDQLMELLTADVIKGSQYVRLIEMVRSSDKENLTVVEEVIKNLK